MPAPQVTTTLARIVAEGAERIGRRWADIARDEQSDRATVGLKELREPLVGYLRELGRILGTFGPDAPPIFGEAVRRLGGLRFEQRVGAGDLVREVEALGIVLVEEWTRRGGALTAEVAVLIRELVAAATAGAVDDFVRRVRASRAHLREAGTIESIVKHVDEGLVAVERDGTISWASDPAARILGTTVANLVGKRREDVVKLLASLGVRDEDGAPIDDEDLPWTEAMETRRASRARLFRLRRGDSDERLVESDAIPIVEEGDLRGAVWTVRDRTDELRAREQLRKAYDELREIHVRLLRRTRSQALGEVAAQVAGALKNNMNTILLRCRLAAENGVPTDELAPIEATVDEMATLVTRLQDLASSRKNDVEEAIPVDEVAREAMDLVRPELTAATEGRELRVEAALASGAKVTGVRSEIREEIVHRLLDAMEAVHGGGTIAVATLRDGKKVVRVVVRATAPGSPTPVYEDHLTVPVAGSATASSSAAPAPVGRPRGPARSVLVVDDDQDNREMLAALLEAHGLTVHQAGNAAEARAIAETSTPDAAFVDLAMPDASGWEVSRALRERHPELRIALVTGYESAVSALPPEGPVEAVFPKPVDVSRLLAFLGLDAPARAGTDHGKELSP